MNQVSQTQTVWDRIARFWDSHIGEGNDFQKTLIMPATDRLLDPQPGENILDIACGNGNYSRCLGRLWVNIVACDFSEEFLACARQRTSEKDGQIEYLKIDAIDPDQLSSLGAHRFDAAVCSMAMMDMPAIDPLLSAIPGLLKAGGRFVFSLPHPCFSSNGARMTAEFVNENGVREQTFGIAIRRYLQPTTELSSGIINQPEPHHFYHRPLSEIFAAIFRARMTVDGLEEPAFPAGASGARNPFSWTQRPEIPPAIVVRARVN